MLPTLFLVPKLYGKIEPLLGMEPRTEKTALDPIGLKVIVCSLAAFAVAILSEMLQKAACLSSTGKQAGQRAAQQMAAGMAVAAAVAIIAILVIKKKADSAAKRV